MPNFINNKARGVHVSPGVYFDVQDITVASKSLGITTLGLAGETLQGPAFQPMLIENWSQFLSYFGGTNTSSFKESNYLKYELPYIAKSYLEQSQQLQVVRVLGLSGYNAGPAWAITAQGTEEGENMLIAILRSRGSYQKAAFVSAADGVDECNPNYEYDKLNYYVPICSHVSLKPTSNLVLGGGCDKMFTTEEGDFIASPTNYGRFDIVGWTGTGSTSTEETEFSYSVSLNQYDKNYILNVLGTRQDDGDAPLYVEELYDVALQELVDRGLITAINQEMVGFDQVYVVPNLEECADLLIDDEITLTRNDVGRRFLATQDSINPETKKMWNVHAYVTTTGDTPTTTLVERPSVVGEIYTVKPIIDNSGVRHYYYVYTDKLDEATNKYVKVHAYDKFFTMVDGEVSAITCDLNNYKEQFRYASTPWIVSELKGGAHSIEITKLFRFHTISDGNAANSQVKISIENIRPDEGLFDVVIRDYYDTDGSPNVLERYGKCSMIPGTSNYIAYKIGSFDGIYEAKSRYVTVEVNESDKAQASIPAGFLGYPVRDYSGVIPTAGASEVCTKPVKAPYFKYNTTIEPTLRNKKQYFGMSNLTGVDLDILTYKGKEAYDETPYGLTPCFHLDSRIDASNGISGQTVSVDGVTGYTWNTVNRNEVLTNYNIEPRFGTEEVIANTIYEDISTRKFTLYPYGGFDGWDVYRGQRSSTDDFKFCNYKGRLNTVSSMGNNFSVFNDPESLNLPLDETCLNTDYYAFLAGARQFRDPKQVDINLFATPGINIASHPLLTQAVLEMVEEDRADSIYVIDLPDHPSGSSNAVTDMYSPEEVVDIIDSSEIDSMYACVTFPSVKVLDTSNNQYVFLSGIRDQVRNFALTDNNGKPWFAAAGIQRGYCDCIKPKKNMTLAQTDTLYEGRINPIQYFSNTGTYIFGNKNLLNDDVKPTNRVNVTRLILRIRKLLSIALLRLIFEQNDNQAKESARTIIEETLSTIKSNRGIENYKYTLKNHYDDESIDSHELICAILVKPTETLEFISINLIITRDNVMFEE